MLNGVYLGVGSLRGLERGMGRSADEGSGSEPRVTIGATRCVRSAGGSGRGGGRTIVHRSFGSGLFGVVDTGTLAGCNPGRNPRADPRGRRSGSERALQTVVEYHPLDPAFYDTLAGQGLGRQCSDGVVDDVDEENWLQDSVIG